MLDRIKVFSNKKRYSFLVVFFVIGILVGCESNLKDIQKDNFSDFVPSNNADEVHLKYTDSGRITGILVSKKMLDYAVVDFPFTEFPKGIHVTLFDKNAKKTVVTSNYAISYKQTGIIDLHANQ